MRPTVFHVTSAGSWSGGGKGVLNNYRHAAARHPAISFDGGDITLINRNYPNTGWRGPFLLAPQNAWPWHGPRLGAKEHVKVAALRAASEFAMRKAVGVVRVGRSIPPRGRMHTRLLPNPLDPDFDEQARNIAATPTPQTSPYLVSLGSINSYRGIEQLLEGYRIYRAAGGELALRVVGGGQQHYLNHVRTLASDIPDVTFSTGSVTRREALRLLHHASAAILPSHVEASPFSLLEAMAVQRNVIASDILGHHDIIPEGVEKPRLFSHQQPQSLANHLPMTEPSPGLPSTPLASTTYREELRVTWGNQLVQILRDLSEGAEDVR